MLKPVKLSWTEIGKSQIAAARFPGYDDEARGTQVNEPRKDGIYSTRIHPMRLEFLIQFGRLDLKLMELSSI